MQILNRLRLFLTVCCVLEFHKNFRECLFMGCILMDCVTYSKQLSDFVFRVFVLGILKQGFEYLGLFVLLVSGLRLLQCDRCFRGLFRFFGDFRGKTDQICWKNDFDDNCKCEKIEENAGKLNRFMVGDERIITEYNLEGEEEEDDDGEKEYSDEVEISNITELRKLVKMERKRANAAYAELEKERAASATAAEEAMAMILRLQNEKSLIEMEANQYRKLVEKKQLHDQEVIRSLQWLVLRHSSERAHLEDQLRLCRRNLKHFVNEDKDECEEVEESSSSLNLGIQDIIAIEDVLYSSLDMNFVEREIETR